MEQTVYADLLFMINFSMDLLCVFLVAKLLARRFSLLRAAFASALGGLYAVASLFVPQGIFSGAATLLVCFLMCLVAFASRREGAVSMLLLTATYFLSSMLLGGIMTAVFNLLNRSVPPLDELTESHGMPLWLFAAVATFSALVTRIGGRFLRTRAQIGCASVEIRLGKRKTVVRAMCDSGNLVHDPISGKPVIVSDMRNAANLLPPSCPPISKWTAETVSELPPSVASRVRVLHVSTASSESMMYALRPDSVTVRAENRTRPVDALIGFANVQKAHADCSAILPTELIP